MSDPTADAIGSGSPPAIMSRSIGQGLCTCGPGTRAIICGGVTVRLASVPGYTTLRHSAVTSGGATLPIRRIPSTLSLFLDCDGSGWFRCGGCFRMRDLASEFRWFLWTTRTRFDHEGCLFLYVICIVLGSVRYSIKSGSNEKTKRIFRVYK